MRTRSQKEQDIKKGKELLEKSQGLVFIDFAKVPTQELRTLRRELKAVGAKLFILKKRLLGLLIKEKGIDFDTKAHKLPLGTIFSAHGIEKVSGIVYKFFAGMEPPEGSAKDVWVKHIIGGYDLVSNTPVGAEQIIFIGKLPPREVLLAQLLGVLVAPLRGLMYILQEKSKRS